MNSQSIFHHKSLSNRHKFIACMLLLFPALLLCTPNFSVGIASALILFSIHYCIINRKNFTLSKTDVLICFIFISYLIANIPNVIIDTGQFRYVESPTKIFLCLSVYFIFKQELRYFNVKPWLEYGTAIGAVGAFIIAAYQFYYLKWPRVDGFLFSINFGYLACSLAFLNLSLLPTSSKKTWNAIGFIVAIIATMLTLTRGAIIAIPILSLLFLWLNKKNINKKVAILCTMLFIAGLTASYFLSNSIKQRVSYTTNEISHILSGNIENAHSSGGRLQLWDAAFQAFKQNPFLGLTYPEREKLNQQLYQEKKSSKWIVGVSRGHAHSQYFEMLASTGILGLLAIIMLLVVPIIILSRQINKPFSKTGIVFITGIGIFGLTEVLLQANLISFYYGIFLAFFLAASQCLPNEDI